MPVGEAEQLGPEADGECPHPDAAPAADEVVSHLVDEDDHGQDEEKRDDGADQQTVGPEYGKEDISQGMPLCLCARRASLTAMAAIPWRRGLEHFAAARNGGAACKCAPGRPLPQAERSKPYPHAKLLSV